MASLRSVAELAWRQLFPEPSKPPITKAEFLATARTEYATQVWILSKNEKNQEGVFNIPSILLSEGEIKVDKKTANAVADISHLEIMRGLSNDGWVQNLGGFECKCKYVKTNVNQRQLFCDDDSLPDNAKTYFVSGNKMHFPNGTHDTKFPITYVNRGLPTADGEEIDDALAGIIRVKLAEIYGGKSGKQDMTNNVNSTS